MKKTISIKQVMNNHKLLMNKLNNIKYIKKMIVDYLIEEYPVDEAKEQVENASIEIIEVIKVVYDNGVYEYLINTGTKLDKLK